MTLEEKIKHYRKQAGLSQEKMAEKIGVSRLNFLNIKLICYDSCKVFV